MVSGLANEEIKLGEKACYMKKVNQNAIHIIIRHPEPTFQATSETRWLYLAAGGANAE